MRGRPRRFKLDLMPKWGLTPSMRETEPWDLSAAWLEPGKVITDPVHGDIYLTELETGFVDSRPLQRLRRVYQLGTTHLVYPGATHTRFSHSLGALRVAQDLLDVVLDQRSGPRPVDDLFAQWEREDPEEYERRVAEATILARLGGLLHDLCHVPFGHSIEDDLGILTAHDKNRERFDGLWSELDSDLQEAVSGALYHNLVPLVLSGAPRGDFVPKYPFTDDIVGNTICADLLDYLRRDHLFTGLPLALGRRFEAGFYVTPEEDPHLAARMVLRIFRPDGKGERTDAITELLKHLRYRYELSERALVHHAKLAADSMIGKALEIWRDALQIEAIDARLREADQQPSDLITDIEDADAAMRSAFNGAKKQREHVSQGVRRTIEEQLAQRGDYGLLEYLSGLASPAEARLDRETKTCGLLLSRCASKPQARQTRGHAVERSTERADVLCNSWLARGPTSARTGRCTLRGGETRLASTDLAARAKDAAQGRRGPGRRRIRDSRVRPTRRKSEGTGCRYLSRPLNTLGVQRVPRCQSRWNARAGCTARLPRTTTQYQARSPRASAR